MRMDTRFIKFLFLIIFIVLVDNVSVKNVETNNTNKNISNVTHHSEIFKVVDWKFSSKKTYFIYAFFIIIVVLMKIFYFHIPKLSLYIPESCILVIIGVIFGVIIRYTVKDEIQYFKLTPSLFFSVLLPPIILESSYSLYHRNFLDNILSILIFAVFGTLMNFLIIGISLWGLSRFGAMQNLNLDLLHCLLFSSLIVAVDPVAVLAIFQDVGVNADLYYLVFGESLLNDAVTVVLYEMMQEFAMMSEISGTNIFLGFISFFTVSIGGMVIGIIVGALSCLIIRLMGDEEIVLLQPILLMSCGYFAYISGDVFGWSGIISTIACGIMQTSYAFYTINDETRLVLKRFLKIISSICEALIFLFLGVELVVGKLCWDTSFSLCTLFLCILTRFIVTFTLSGIINKVHVSIRNIPLREKVIISYGGLRGAVAFSLAILIIPEVLPAKGINKEIIITTTLFIILFTIIVQGITVKPLVKVLQITRETYSERLSLFDELNESVFDASNCGINSILGKCRRNYFFMVIEKFNDKYLRPALQGHSMSSYSSIAAINEKINLTIIANLNEKSSTHDLQRKLPGSYVNLVSALSNPQPKPSVDIPTVTFRHLQHSMSDVSGLAKVKRLSPHLIRVSTITKNDPYSVLNLPNFADRASELIKVKNKFLSFRHSQREVKSNKPLITLEELKAEEQNDDSNNKEKFF